jgi:hypothetical protein
MEIRNPFTSISDKIPEDEREAVTAAVNRMYGLPPTQPDMETLFRVWNTYINPEEPQSIGCRGCRSTVVGKLRNVVKLWENAN